MYSISEIIKGLTGSRGASNGNGGLFAIPKSVQEAIQIKAVFPDGIFQISKDLFTMSYRFTDINYAVAGLEAQREDYKKYCTVLNALDDGVSSQITIMNRRIKGIELHDMLLRKQNDAHDVYRQEINDMLTNIANSETAIIQEKYITISVRKKTVDDARTHFHRVSAELDNRFKSLGSGVEALDVTERLRIIHDFCRPGEDSAYHFDLRDTIKKGQDFRDYISPDGFEFKSDYFMYGSRYARVLFLRDFPSYIRDDVIQKLTDANNSMVFTFDILPMSTQEAQKISEKLALGVETNIANYQRKQNNNRNYTAVIPWDMEQQRKEAREVLQDITENDEKMFRVVMTIMHTADTLEQLNADTEIIKDAAKEATCQIAVLRYQQLEGLNATLPIGINNLPVRRTFLTGSLAAFIPFKAQEIRHKGGTYQGVNSISKNMIFVNRKQLQNGNCFVLGVPGSGKSFTAKEEIINLFLSRDCDIIIIDPEREYQPVVNALNGQVILLSATSESHINCLDINAMYSDGANPIPDKSAFVMSLFEQISGREEVTQLQKSIIDRCLTNIYTPYINNGYTGTAPTLVDLVNELKRQPEPTAQDLGVQMELFSTGSHNTFAHQTNVDIHNRLVSYDILDLGSQLMPIGMLTILDSVLNRITRNRISGRETYILIDEIYLLFRHDYSAEFLETLWKRVRKYGAFCTGITQNVDDLLQSHSARNMISNSEFVVMLNQGAADRDELASLLQISEDQKKYITNAQTGHGLLKVGAELVPFERKFPKNTKLYRLMSTKVGEFNS